MVSSPASGYTDMSVNNIDVTQCSLSLTEIRALLAKTLTPVPLDPLLKRTLNATELQCLHTTASIAFPGIIRPMTEVEMELAKTGTFHPAVANRFGQFTLQRVLKGSEIKSCKTSWQAPINR